MMLESDAWHELLSRRQDILPIIQSEIFGVANGSSDWVDRNRASGNGVVPLAAGYAWRVLEDCIQMGGVC